MPITLRRLSPAVICGLVWRWLDSHQGHRPAVRDIAAAIGVTERQLRHAWSLKHGHAAGEPLRVQITYGCLTFALLEISRGCKCVAAVRAAGFKSLWNFNRQCRAFGFPSSRFHRSGTSLQLSPQAVEKALLDFERQKHLRGSS